MPQMCSRLGIKRQEVTIIVASEENAARCGNGAGPHASAAGHRVFPGAFGGFRIDGAQDYLASVFGSAAAGEVFHRYWLLGRTVEHAALLKSQDIQQARAWVIALAHPVCGPFYAGTYPIAFGRWILARDDHGFAFVINA